MIAYYTFNRIGIDDTFKVGYVIFLVGFAAPKYESDSAMGQQFLCENETWEVIAAWTNTFQEHKRSVLYLSSLASDFEQCR